MNNSDILVNQFLDYAKKLNAAIDLIKVLKSRTYHIGDSNVLIRAASNGNARYFFGLNYIHAEEMANLDNPFIAFICGAVEKVVIIPAQILFSHLDKISHDRNGEYKINIDNYLNIVLAGRNKRLDCSTFVNNWDSLINPRHIASVVKNTVEESFHSVLQGRLLEIGNMRGFKTYCPDKTRTFNKKKLEEIATLSICPQLQFSNYKLLREIDVLWFRVKGSNLIPEHAFEVELSTGVWSGVIRMATLIDYANVNLYIIANDARKFNRVISPLTDISSRYKFVSNNMLGDLYSAEKNLKELRYEIGL
jgi:hypothetical protein